MLSVLSSNAGMREKPPSIARSIASSTVASAAMATMSGRGSITSRTTVSPNSKIEWMSWRSSTSIDSSSAATSAIARRSSSVTNGPSLRPRPGSRTLPRPISALDSSRKGAKTVTAYRKPRDAERRPVRVLDGVRLGHHLGDHEEEHDLDDEADEHAGRAEHVVEDDAEQRGRHEVRQQDEEQHRVERLLGMLQELGQPRRALLPLVLEGERPDPAHAGERRLAECEERREQEEDDDRCDAGPVGARHCSVSSTADVSPSSARNFARSSCSHACIRVASSSSAWS